MTLATLVLLAAFVSLGRWQWHRGEAKQAVWAEFARETAPQALGSSNPDEMPRFAHVTLRGHYLPDRQILLDNRSHQAFCQALSDAGRPCEGGLPWVINGARHEILFERDAMRAEALNAILRFFAQHLGGALPPTTPSEVRT